MNNLRTKRVGVLHVLGVESRHREAGGKLVDTLADILEGGIVVEKSAEVLELRSGSLLDLEGSLQDLVQEFGDLFEVLFAHLTGSKSRGSNTDSTGCDGGSVTGDAVLIEGDADGIASLLELGSGNSLGLQVPQDQVVLGTSRGHLVSVLGLKTVSKGSGVGLNLLGVDLEFRGHDLLELGGNTGNLVLVRSSLKGRENGLVDLGLEATLVLAEEDHSGTRSTEGLVGGGSDDITVFERRVLFSGGDQSGNVGHVHHQKRSVGVGDFSVFGVVPVTRVGRSSGNDHGRFEKGSITGELFVVNVSGFRVDAVRKRFEVDRSGRDGLTGSLLLGVCVESVSQVTTRWKIKSHDTVVGVEESSVDGEVGRGSRVWLDVDTPLFGVQAVGLEGTLLAHDLDLVNNLVTSVVTGVGKTLRVLVGEGGSQTFHDGLGGEVLRGNQFQRTPLAVLFLLDQVVQFRIVVRKGDESSEFLSFQYGCRLVFHKVVTFGY